MSGDDIVQRLRRWDGGISTHWVGCFDSHPVCAIRLAADAIEARDAEIERLRAAGDALAEVALLAVVCCRDNEVEQCNRAYAAWQEARREQW